MQTTISIDDALLRKAEACARESGKSLSTLVEDALRQTIGSAVPEKLAPAPTDNADALQDDDPFFAALEEVRALGRATFANLRQAG